MLCPVYCFILILRDISWLQKAAGSTQCMLRHSICESINLELVSLMVTSGMCEGGRDAGGRRRGGRGCSGRRKGRGVRVREAGRSYRWWVVKDDKGPVDSAAAKYKGIEWRKKSRGEWRVGEEGGRHGWEKRRALSGTLCLSVLRTVLQICL